MILKKSHGIIASDEIYLIILWFYGKKTKLKRIIERIVLLFKFLQRKR